MDLFEYLLRQRLEPTAASELRRLTAEEIDELVNKAFFEDDDIVSVSQLEQ